MQVIQPIIIPPFTNLTATDGTTQVSSSTTNELIPWLQTLFTPNRLESQCTVVENDGTASNAKCVLTFTGIRQDNSEFHMGSATYNTTPAGLTTHDSVDATWTSFNMDNYLTSGSVGNNSTMRFDKVSFALNEVDPINGGLFKNANAIRIKAKLVFSRRTRVRKEDSKNEIMYPYIINTANTLFYNLPYNNTTWTTDARVSMNINGGSYWRGRDMSIGPNDEKLVIGCSLNETIAGSGYVHIDLTKLLPHAIGIVDYEGNPFYVDLSLSFANTRGGFDVGVDYRDGGSWSLVVDWEDPMNSNRPTFYVTSNIGGAIRTIHTISAAVTTTTPSDDTYNNTEGFPIFTSGGLNLGAGSLGAEPWFIYTICPTWRVNDRPLIYATHNNPFWTRGVALNQNTGTWAAPSYNRRLWGRTDAGSPYNANLIPLNASFSEGETNGGLYSYGYISGTANTSRNIQIHQLTHNGTANYMTVSGDWTNFNNTVIMNLTVDLTLQRTRAVPINTGTFDTYVIGGNIGVVADKTRLSNGRAILYVADYVANVILRLEYDGINPAATDGSNYTYTILAGNFTTGSPVTPTITRTNGIGGTLDFGIEALGRTAVYVTNHGNFKMGTDWLYYMTTSAVSDLMFRVHVTTGEVQYLFGRTYDSQGLNSSGAIIKF